MRIRILLATLLLAALPFSVLDAQEIRSIKTDVVLNFDGSAEVTQTWDVTVVSGTEWYIPITNLRKMEISDFSVSENGVEFENEGRRWDIDRSLEKKAGKCGIHETDEGLELCWGQGSLGNHVWVSKYHISGLVQSLDDYDAFNHQFVNPGLVASPEYISLRIINNAQSEDWTTDNTRIWAFGFEGTINIVDGQIVAESQGRVQYANVMVRFDKGIFDPAVSRDMTFEELQNKAFKGSEYNDSGESFALVIAILCFLLFGIFLVYMAIQQATGKKYKKSLFGKNKITEWYREAPFGGNIPASWYVYSSGYRFVNESKPNNLVGAYFLRWILEGALKVQKDPNRPKKVSLAFTDVKPHFNCEEEESFYNMAAEASGDMVLESAEFRNWSRQHSETLIKWPEEIRNAGYAYLVNNKFMTGKGKSGESHYQDFINVIAFKNFLNDFTLSSEREANDVKLWKDYLVYAQMFGIASKVAKQFKSLYPEFFEEVAQSSGLDTLQLIYLINWTNSMSNSGYNSAVQKVNSSASKGFGGGTSFGGGGGFSGGGFGGGSR